MHSWWTCTGNWTPCSRLSWRTRMRRHRHLPRRRHSCGDCTCKCSPSLPCRRMCSVSASLQSPSPHLWVAVSSLVTSEKDPPLSIVNQAVGMGTRSSDNISICIVQYATRLAVRACVPFKMSSSLYTCIALDVCSSRFATHEKEMTRVANIPCFEGIQ